MAEISKLYNALTEDPWRSRKPFTEEMQTSNREITAPSNSDADSAHALAKFLVKSQPCLFGRMAAGALDILNYCIITEADIVKGDRRVRDKIQQYRLHWRREALRGRRSGFIILATSKRLTLAEPNEQLKEFALKLCTLYLREAIEPDTVHHERLTLEIQASSAHDQSAWYTWRVGVNFFGAAGDQRWWHDHRIPGGVGFSMNSVGHMARSGSLHNMASESRTGGIPKKGRLQVDSLARALRFAMQTITNAQNTVSGKATCLRDLTQEAYDQLAPKCPFTPAGPLVLKDYTTYDGWYDTDATVPSDYFRPDVARPADVDQRSLNFTYLFDDSPGNPDHETMGQGEQTQ